LDTRPSEKRLRTYWRVHAEETMRGWLKGDAYPQHELFDWGPFRKATRQGLDDALRPSLDAIASNPEERNSVRVRAARSMGYLRDKKSLKDLLMLSGDPSPVVRETAATALRRRQIDLDAVAAELAHGLSVGERDERCRAARSVASLRVSSPDILRALVKMVREMNLATAEAGAEALAALGDEAKDVLWVLEDLAKDQWVEEHNRRQASRATGIIQRAASDAMARELKDELAQVFPFLQS